MGDIPGQTQQSASWIVRGDESGTYEISADFNGVLMPFGDPVSATFETEKTFEVTTGEGIHIRIMPEEKAYVLEDYYIQFQVTNESTKPIYNFTTSIGAYEEPDRVQQVVDGDTGEILESATELVVSGDPGNLPRPLW